MIFPTVPKSVAEPAPLDGDVARSLLLVPSTLVEYNLGHTGERMSTLPSANTARQRKLDLVILVLVGFGVLMMLAGGILCYPYVHSRLAPLLPTPISEPAFLPLIAPPPTATPVPPTTTPSPTPTPASAIPRTVDTPIVSPSAVPTESPVPTPTPTPAIPTHIEIPMAGVDASVVTVSWQPVEVGGQTQAMWEVPAMYAAGWHEASAPLSAHDNTVLNGHNTTYGEVFRDLYKLATGDTITVYSNDVPFTYLVSEVLILPEAGQPLEVRLENARYILPTEDKRLTLITCHPYGSLRNRLVVIAHPSVAAGATDNGSSGPPQRTTETSDQ